MLKGQKVRTSELGKRGKMKDTLRQEMIDAVEIIAIADCDSRTALCFLSGYLDSDYPEISEIIQSILDCTRDSDFGIADTSYEKGFNAGYSYMREKVESTLR